MITQNVSPKCVGRKKIIIKKFKTLEFRDPFLHHHEISRVFDFQKGGCPPSWIFKLKFLSPCTSETHSAQLCRDLAFYCCRHSAIFRVFLVKCKNSLDDRT